MKANGNPVTEFAEVGSTVVHARIVRLGRAHHLSIGPEGTGTLGSK